MEDRHVIARALGGRPDVTLLAVFDGHRGDAAAAFAAQHVAEQVETNWPRADCAERCMEATFLKLDERFRAAQDAAWAARVARVGADAAGARPYPGCTALVLLQARLRCTVQAAHRRVFGSADQSACADRGQAARGQRG